MRIFDQLRDTHVKKDGLGAWAICFCALINNAVVVGIDSSFGVIIASVIETLDSNPSAVSWIPSIRSTCMYFVAWVSTMLVQRFGFRVVFTAGAVLSCLAFAVAVLNENFIILMLSYGIIGGSAAGLLHAPGNIVVSYYFEKHRKIASGIAICGGGVGIAIIEPLTNLINITFGPKGVYVAFSLLSLLPLFLSIATFPTDDNDDANNHGIKELQSQSKHKIHLGRRLTVYQIPTNSHTDRKLSIFNLKLPVLLNERKQMSFLDKFALLKDFRLLFYCLSHITFLLAFYIPIDYLPEMMVEEHGLPKSVGGTIMAIFGVSQIVGRASSGVIATVLTRHSIIISSLSMVGIGSGIIGFVFCSTYREFIGATIFYGLCIGCFYYNSVNILAEMYGVTDNFQDAYGLLMLASAISPIWGPPIGGMLHEYFGKFYMSFMAAGIFAYVSAFCNIIVFFIHFKKYQKQI